MYDLVVISVMCNTKTGHDKPLRRIRCRIVKPALKLLQHHSRRGHEPFVKVVMAVVVYELETLDVQLWAPLTPDAS